MPIKIRKNNKQNTYKVYNILTKEVHSYATTKQKALRQKKLLDAIDHGFIPSSSKKGGSITKPITKITEPITNRVKAIITGHREEGLPPKSRDTLKKYGDIPIKTAVIFRYEIPSAITAFLQVVTKNKVFKNVDYDKLFHLGMIFRLQNGESIIIEKNQVINISNSFPSIPKTADIKSILIPSSLTLNEIINNTRNKMGLHNFEYYSALSTNCQNFISNLLQSNHLGNTNDINFVKQDLTQLIKEVNKHPILNKLINTSTDLARSVDVILQGASRLTGGILPLKQLTFNKYMSDFLLENPNLTDDEIRTEVSNRFRLIMPDSDSEINRFIDEYFQLAEFYSTNIFNTINRFVDELIETNATKSGNVEENLSVFLQLFSNSGPRLLNHIHQFIRDNNDINIKRRIRVQLWILMGRKTYIYTLNYFGKYENDDQFYMLLRPTLIQILINLVNGI